MIINSFQIVKNFSRRTGIRDTKLDTFLKLKHENQHLDSLALSLTSPQKWSGHTFSVDQGVLDSGYDTVTFWHQKIKTEQVSWWKDYDKWINGNWEPHQRQRDSYNEFSKFDYNKSHHNASEAEEMMDGKWRLIKRTTKRLVNPRGRILLEGITPYDKKDKL